MSRSPGRCPLGNINVNFNGNLDASIHGRAEPLYLALPGYTFATPVLGGQFNITVAIPYGRIESSVDATIIGSFGLGGPGFTVGRSLTETATGFGDLGPMASLRWNFGVHNFMTYLTGNLTTGVYHSQFDCQSRYRAQRNRWWRCLYLLRPEGRTRIFRNTWFHLQLRKHAYELSERHRYASGFGCIAIPDQAVAGRTCWLLVPAAFLRQRLRQPLGCFEFTRGRHWTTDRLYLSDQQRMAGIREPQGLRGICRTEQGRRLERLAHVRHFTGSPRGGAPISQTHDHEVGDSIKFLSRMNASSGSPLCGPYP